MLVVWPILIFFLFLFSILKNSCFLSFAVNFLKAVEKNWKKNVEKQVEIINKKLKKFGVFRYIPQNTADNRYPLDEFR